MEYYSSHISNLIEQLSSLPGIGAKSAQRLAFHIVNMPPDQVQKLADSMTDARTLGIKAPIRESGVLEGTPGCKLVGPCGEVEIDHGVIVALRHVHLNPEQAEEAGVKDKDIVCLKVGGERGLIFDNVLVRAGVKHEREVHLDTDEGNAAGCGPDAVAEIIK